MMTISDFKVTLLPCGNVFERMDFAFQSYVVGKIKPNQ